MLDAQINEFWDWFEKNSNKLCSDNYDRDLLQKLDQTILDFGLTWEIGPGLTKENSFLPLLVFSEASPTKIFFNASNNSHNLFLSPPWDV